MIRKIVLILALCLLIATPAMAQNKIAVADLVLITATSDAGKSAEQQLQSLFGNEKNQLEAQANTLNQKVEELQRQAAAMSEQALNTRSQEIQRMAQELDQKSAAYGQRLGRVQQAISSQMQEIVMTACSDFASKNGYDMILDTSGLLFAVNALDVTQALTAEVNRIWKSRGSKFTIPN